MENEASASNSPFSQVMVSHIFSSPKLISWPFSHIPFPGKKIPFFSSKNYRFLFSSLWLHISNYPALYTYAKISQAGTAQLLCRLPKTVNWEEKGSWNRSLQECCAVMDMGDMVRMSVTIGHWEEKECYSAIENIFKSDWKSIVLMTSNAKNLPHVPFKPLIFLLLVWIFLQNSILFIPPTVFFNSIHTF